MSLVQADKADICLLLEGTFPYVSGGVSSWVNQIIRGFPQYTFACCFLGSRVEDYGELKYDIPDNVVHIEVHYLYNPEDKTEKKPVKGDKEVFAKVCRYHQSLKAGDTGLQREQDFSDMLNELDDGGSLSEDCFLHSRASWDFIADNYRQYSRDPSFIDYFWTVRNTHAPIWILKRIADNIIPAKIYHTISTGYAGFLGAMIKRRLNKPLLLSEHGIYTKERKIDLFQSEWIKDNRSLAEKNNTEMAYFREKWINFFSELGRESYLAANKIVALYEANRQRQITDGAQAQKTLNIPNGIDLPRMQKIREARPEKNPLVACLIGRIVPIKDIKTFLRAMRTVVDVLPSAQGWLAGPEDEDPEYAQECHGLIASLGLENNVQFLGFQKIDELLPKVSVNVLSSISEALPLVLLEGFAAGVPAVATDVGSCRQLIEGLGDEDKALGRAGAVVNIADPEALGREISQLLSDSERWQSAQQAGIKRVEKYYTQEIMFEAYQTIYQQLIEESH